jgi:hypothetical protein
MKPSLTFILLFGLTLCQFVSGQNDTTVLGIDSIVSRGNEYTITHFHVISGSNGNKILLGEADSLFNEGYNNFSRLIFEDREHSFNVPTIPLTHLIYLNKSSLILGISKIAISPYQIVLYSPDGKLVYKGSITAFELKVTRDEAKNLLKLFPNLKKCLPLMSIVKENEFFYLPINQCLINSIGRDNILKMNTLRMSHYFPYISQPIIENSFYAHYVQWYNFFSDSDPLYDLIIMGSTPYLLILNSEEGARVNIPLITDSKILEEFR